MLRRVYYGKFKPGRGFEFIEWFKKEENVRQFGEALPEGATFVDAYIVESGDADHHFEIVYDLTGYEVLDRWNIKDKKFKSFFQNKLLGDLGFYSSDDQIKFVRSVKDVDTMDYDAFKQIMAKEKERSEMF